MLTGCNSHAVRYNTINILRLETILLLFLSFFFFAFSPWLLAVINWKRQHTVENRKTALIK